MMELKNVRAEELKNMLKNIENAVYTPIDPELRL